MSTVPGSVGGGLGPPGTGPPSSSKKRTKIVFLSPTEVGNWDRLECNAEQKLLDKDDMLRYEKLLKNKPSVRKKTNSAVTLAARKTCRSKPAKNASRKKVVDSYAPWLGEDDSDEADAGLEGELDDDEYFRRLEEEKQREDEEEARRKKQAARAKKSKPSPKKQGYKVSRRISGNSARRGSQPNYAVLAGLVEEDSGRDDSEYGDGTVSSYSGSKLDYEEVTNLRTLSPHEELDEDDGEEDRSERSYPVDDLSQSLDAEEEDAIMEEDEQQSSTRPDTSSRIVSDQLSVCPVSSDPFTIAMLNVDPIQLLYQSPHLALPPSASDLVCPKGLIMDAFSIYEILNRYNRLLRLSPFKVEDFLAALTANENSVLLAEIHIALLRALTREDDAAGTLMYPVDSKDSVTITFHLLDRFNWPHLLAAYLASVKSSESAALAAASSLSSMSMAAAYAAGAAGCGPTGGGGADNVLTAALFPDGLIPLDPAYPFVPVEKRVAVLRGLANLIVATGPVRGDILRDGFLPHEDHCRVCHQSGDVLCCDGCTAVYHLTCLNPPLQSAPSSSWLCPICVKHQTVDGMQGVRTGRFEYKVTIITADVTHVTGVSECLTEEERSGRVHRREPIGTDRAGRVYWYIGRRLLVEPVNFAQREPHLPGLMEGVYDPQWIEQYFLQQLRSGEIISLPESADGAYDDTTGLPAPYVRCNPLVDYALEPPVYYYSCVDQVMELRRRLSTQWEPWLCHRLDALLPRLSTEMRTTETMTDEGMELFCQAHPDFQRLSSTSTSASTELKNVFSVFELESARSKSSIEDSGPTVGTNPPQTISTAPVKTECAFDQVPSYESCYAPACLETPTKNPPLTEGDEFNESNAILAVDVKNCFYRNRDGIVIQTSRSEQSTEPTPATVLTENEHLELSLTSCLPPGVAQTKGAKLVAYRLSDEGTWRSWTNAYTTGVWSGSETNGSKDKLPESLDKKHPTDADETDTDSGPSVNIILTRQQFMEEKERRRLLGNKFSMTDLALDMWRYMEPPAVAYQLSEALEFLKVPCKLAEDFFSPGWFATVPRLFDVLRLTMCYFEAQLPTCFYTPAWRCFRNQWIETVLRASNPIQLADALAQFEASVRPVCYQRVWSNAIGHIAYERTTMAQREEDRRIRQIDRSGTSSANHAGSTAAANVPANLIRTRNPGPIRHSVWKYRGEEYRRLGGDGWMWLSSTRRAPAEEVHLVATAYPRLNQVVREGTTDSLQFGTSRPTVKRGLQHGIGWGVCPEYLQGEVPIKPPKPSECRGHVLHPITGIPLYLNPRRTSYVIPVEELSRIQAEALAQRLSPDSLTKPDGTPRETRSEPADPLEGPVEKPVAKSAEIAVTGDTSPSVKTEHQDSKTHVDADAHTDERSPDSLNRTNCVTSPVLNVSYCLQERIHFPPVVVRPPISPSLRSRRLRYRLDRLLARRQFAADTDKHAAQEAEASIHLLETEMIDLEKQRAELTERLSSLSAEIQEARTAKARAIKEKTDSAKSIPSFVSKGPVSSAGPVVSAQNQTGTNLQPMTKPLIQHSVLDFGNGPRFRVIAPRIDKQHCTALYQRTNDLQPKRPPSKPAQVRSGDDDGGGSIGQQLRRSSRKQKAVRRDPDFVVDFDDDDDEENEEEGEDNGGGTESADEFGDTGRSRPPRRTIPQFDGAGDEESSDAGNEPGIVVIPTGTAASTDPIEQAGNAEVEQVNQLESSESVVPADSTVPAGTSSTHKQTFQVISSPDLPGHRILRVVRAGDVAVSKQVTNVRLPVNGDPTMIVTSVDATEDYAQSQVCQKTLQSGDHAPTTLDPLSLSITISNSTVPITQVRKLIRASENSLPSPPSAQNSGCGRFRTRAKSADSLIRVFVSIILLSLQLVGLNQSPKSTAAVSPTPAIQGPIVLPQNFRLPSGATSLIAAGPIRIADGKVIRTLQNLVPSNITGNRLNVPVTLSGSTPIRVILSAAPTSTSGSAPVVLTTTPVSAIPTSAEAIDSTGTIVTTNLSAPLSNVARSQPAILRRTLATVSTPGQLLPNEVKYFTIPQSQSIASVVAASTARKIVCGDPAPAPVVQSQPPADTSTLQQSRRSMAKTAHANDESRSAAVLLRPRLVLPQQSACSSTPNRLVSLQARAPTEAQVALNKAVTDATERLREAEAQAASVRSELAALDKRIADVRKKLVQQRALLSRGTVSTAQPYSLIRNTHIQSVQSGDEVLLPASLPPVNTYVWPPVEWKDEYKKRQSSSSLFRWNVRNLRWLILSAGRRELPGYDTEKKRLAQIVWPYPTAKPTLSETWRFRLSQLRLGPDRLSAMAKSYQPKDYGQDMANIALLMRILWHCIRWDDILGEPADNVHVLDADGRPCFRELMDYEDSGTGRAGQSAYCTRKIVGIQPLDKHWQRANYLVRLTHTRPSSSGAAQTRRTPGRNAKRSRRTAHAATNSSASESSTASPVPHSSRKSKSRKSVPRQDPDYDPFGDDSWWGSASARRRKRRPGANRNNQSSAGAVNENSAASHQEIRVEERWMAEDHLFLWEIRTFMNEYLPPNHDYLHVGTEKLDGKSQAVATLRRPARLSTVPPSVQTKTEEANYTKQQPEELPENREEPPPHPNLANALVGTNTNLASSGIIWDVHSGFRISGDPTVRLIPALSTRRRAYQRDSNPPDSSGQPEQTISPSVLEAKARARSLAASHAAKASVAARRMRNERALLEQRVRSLRSQILTRRRLHLSLARLISQDSLSDFQERDFHRERPTPIKVKQPPQDFPSKTPFTPLRGVTKRGRPPLSSRNRQSSQEASPRPKDVPVSRTGTRAFWNEDQENEPHWITKTSGLRRFSRGLAVVKRGRGRGRARFSRVLTNRVSASRKYRKPEDSPLPCPKPDDQEPHFDNEHSSSSGASTPSTSPGLGDETLERILIPSTVLKQDEPHSTPRGAAGKRRAAASRCLSTGSRGRAGRGRGYRGRPAGLAKGQTIRLPTAFAAPSPSTQTAGPNIPDSTTLYCLCKTPYDPTREYLGCDLCQDWFHFECVGLRAAESGNLGESWHCPDCKKAEIDANEMLYCLCRTPYEPLRVYIACDGCDEWYHAECVGMTSEQAASHTGTYICPTCSKNAPNKPEGLSISDDHETPVKADPDTSSAAVTTIYETALESDTKMRLLELVEDMMHHKMAWPLVQVLDPQKYPAVVKLSDIKNLCTLLTELTQDMFETLGDFAFAMNRIFSDARTVFPQHSPEFHCADVMEAYFIQQMKRIKAGLDR
ncbi:PHD-finger [Opisthorchis viverrini]|uniref:PHD-finger n=1 Tax=Opisthorchis viverrini TaxID=6198 RepID=A0A1S8WZ19_OPIVI|nr:PHD-finger [Opisthorchis viverrini]